MKRIGNLYDKIISRENILHAYNNAIKKAMIKKRHNRKSLTSYYGWCIHCNSKNLLKKLNVYENIFRQSA